MSPIAKSTSPGLLDTTFFAHWIQTPIHQHRHYTYNKKQQSQNVIRSQYLKYTGHVCHCPNTTLTKKKMFAKSRHPYKWDPWINIAKSFKLMSPLSRKEVYTR